MWYTTGEIDSKDNEEFTKPSEMFVFKAGAYQSGALIRVQVSSISLSCN